MPHLSLRSILSLAVSASLALAAAPLVLTDDAATAAPALDDRPLHRAPAAPEGEWVAGDLHVHTTDSHDSWGGPEDPNTGPEEFYTAGSTVEQRFRDAHLRGLDFLAITDHNTVEAQDDEGWDRFGVLGLPAYENSLQGHAQMLGATEVYEDHDNSVEAVRAEAEALRADGGVFQVNHPTSPSGDPDDLDWSYGYEIVPDTVEVWNITSTYQPPFPSANNDEANIRYWEGWLDRGEQVAATGASDSHWVATGAAQGPGQPTTWVWVTDRSVDGVLDGLRAGRTTISAQPPAAGGARVFLEADADADGVFESMVGDTVPPQGSFRVRVEDAAGALLQLVGDGGEPLRAPVEVVGDRFTLEFLVPDDATWVRAEVVRADLQAERTAACDPVVGGQTTYCRNRLVREAMTSALYLDHDAPVVGADTYAYTTNDEAVIGNGVVERRFALDAFGTTSFTDLRTGFRTGASDDLRLRAADGVELAGPDLTVTDATARTTRDGGHALTLRLEPLDGVLGREPGFGAAHVERTYTTYPGVAGIRVQTTVAVPGTWTGYVLDEVAVPDAVPTAQHFNAGYDWRGSDTPDWTPTVAPFGGAHTGDHRETATAARGEALDVTGQWLTLDTDADDPASPRAFQVLERVNYDSSHVAYDGAVGSAHVDLADDLLYLGPFEADVHLDNPTGAPLRARVVAPGEALELESVFTGLALDADDEPWQHHRYLTGHRGADWARHVTFNSNGVDEGRISTGAKDDMDLDETVRQAEVARRLGVETFILDDGWQAASGDWCPDSPDCPEPRGLYPDRFPDDDFTAVREVLGGMELGLWMSPMHFNPASEAYRANPTWACTPLGDALAGYNTVEPDTSSNEAGLGTWNPEAMAAEGRLIDHIEGRIRRQVTEYGATYFKFDFLVWLDCLDALDTVTAYDYRESFVAMLDRVQASHPHVTLQVDETNDYRLWPFESAARGPVWFANGNPTADQALHNLWVLAPYVPGSVVGQSTLTGEVEERGVDYLMAAALPSHLTFFRDLTSYTDAQVERAALWTDLYKRHRDRFTSMSYPLLDDPLGGTTWTGLQPWDPEAQVGALLVFRQDHPDDTVEVALRGIRGQGAYRLTDALTGEVVRTASAEQLRRGIPVTLPERHSAAVWLVDPLP